MSMGSDFASGYSMGLNTRQLNQGPSINPYAYLAEVSRGNTAHDVAMINAMGRGGGSRGGVPAPKEILTNAREESLRQKGLELDNIARELDIKAKELNIRDLELDNIARELDIKAKELNIRDAERRSSDEYIKRADDRARGLATDNQAYEAEQNKAQQEAAIRGFYTRDRDSILNFINKAGNAQISAIDWGPDNDPDLKGTVSVQYDNGGVQVFESPSEAVKNLILPMMAIQQESKGAMTEYERGKLEADEDKLAFDKYKTLFEQGEKANKASGSLTAREINEKVENFVNNYVKANYELPSQKEIDLFKEYIAGEAARGVEAGEPEQSGKTPEIDIENERMLANEAIESGKGNADNVKRKFKEKTGQDL